MSGRLIKVTVICVILIGLGISFKPIFKRVGSVSNAAEKPDASVEPARTEAYSSKYDFSDSSHWNLTVSAWENLAQKDYEGVSAYVRKCLEMYEPKAREMAAGMKSFSRPGREDDFDLVNDVATSHYIMGEAYMKLGRQEDALKEFNYVIDNYPYALCWDPKGWFWKVAEVSKKNIDKIVKQTPPVSR
jgi:tetratricopeptide (TPR) repeat protein